MEVKCTSMFGHKYEHVITKDATTGNLGEYSGSHAAAKMILDASRKETFNGIYCTRCGNMKEFTNE